MDYTKCKKEIEEAFPLCMEHNPDLFNNVCYHLLIISEVAEKINIPLEEMLEFFYNGKIKLDILKEQEEVLRRHGGQAN